MRSAGIPARRGRWAVKLALGAASLAALAILLELGFRIFESLRLARGELWAVYDAELGYRPNPAYGDHNALGLRDDEPAPKGDRLRIVMLGDSVAYYGVDAADTYPGRLERVLSEQLARPVDVVNAGVKGWTNYQELAWLARDGLALEPDLVGVGFVLNDCHRVLHAFRVEDGKIVGQDYDLAPEVVAGVESPLYRILRKSRFLVWLRHRLGRLVDDGALAGGDGFSFVARPDFGTAWRDEPWRAVEAQLEGLVALGAREGFRPFLVVFPFGDQYRADYLARDRERVLKPQRELGLICTRLGLPGLDVYPLLERAHLEEDGIHLTAAGRARAAELIADFLAEQDLLHAR